METSYLPIVTMRSWLNGFAIEAPEIAINNISADSRSIRQGDCFIALFGETTDGAQFISQAVKKGAVAILASSNCNIDYQGDIPVIEVDNLEKIIGELASAFYQYPTSKMKLAGVTGTNGKTTTAFYIASIVDAMGKSAGLIGTLGQGMLNNLAPSLNTTPGAIELQQQLHALQQQHCEVVAMEVSSHGLYQHRVTGCQFDTVIFTNLSRDHLDYHSTMSEYKAAKKRLFTEFNAANKVVNIDDPVGQMWFNEFKQQPNAKLIAFGCWQPELEAEYYVCYSDLSFTQAGIATTLKTSWGDFQLTSPVFGLFNLSNLVAAIATLVSMGFDMATVIENCQELTSVAGRMEVFKGEQGATVIVDYAHTPDALLSVLSAVKEHSYKKIWCVFGCGGDRDSGKRPLMGSIAQQHADFIVVTNDNPRTEQPELIIDGILSGMKSAGNVMIEPDRQKAIWQAFQCADDDDVIVVAGKGHEDYQVIGEKTVSFNERAIVASLVWGAA
ncbi:UDP-N-acetylmuramoyl-L-alanyl-D-glutamate--2,6-diaminopimelate ligase [Flocculibacter collagenilyticus]|uniref:UDP-N-acetylmuramoyl-L-alanyl-D-glutamate--2, 6-diaminopimelate ligase n=1 Tax=Flocculibacter collagenilyticus TaxID=2744479 RepID=UPI0018F6F38A|nr:UDP-N-acetylmuramoyl-L-alanyl-D-glutamate--2,6-diaminopimelate ligase [Flocculibacter collagenilyticus]